MKKIITVEKEIEVCDFCGQEVNAYQSYCECEICGKDVCKSCRVDIESHRYRDIIICPDCKNVDLSEYIKVHDNLHKLQILQERAIHKSIRIMDKIKKEYKHA